MRSMETKIENVSGCWVISKAVAFPQNRGNSQQFFQCQLLFLPDSP